MNRDCGTPAPEPGTDGEGGIQPATMEAGEASSTGDIFPHAEDILLSHFSLGPSALMGGADLQWIKSCQGPGE